MLMACFKIDGFFLNAAFTRFVVLKLPLCVDMAVIYD
jgi:hypothetical protein